MDQIPLPVTKCMIYAVFLFLCTRPNILRILKINGSNLSMRIPKKLIILLVLSATFIRASVYKIKCQYKIAFQQMYDG